VMNSDELQKHISWLRHEDNCASLASGDVPRPWFPAYRRTESNDERTTCFSALVPPTLIPKLVKNSRGWDISIGDGVPAIWTSWPNGLEKHTYTAFGNDSGIEPLVIRRSFYGLRSPFNELCQEFRLYHNLYQDQSRKRFVLTDRNGDEHEAARYGDNFFEIKTDLLLEFCAAKQIALAIYFDGFRDSKTTLAELGIDESRINHEEERYEYSLAVLPFDSFTKTEIRTTGHISGKKYILPRPIPLESSRTPEAYQEFVIGTDPTGKPIRFTCDPEQLANFFGKNPTAPNYLTPVFFRAEVLSKYYGDPQKYSVEDGILRCGGLWSMRIDNDHSDCVVVWLGDLGRDLSEAERNYWLSFNILPEGRKISETSFRRNIRAQFADPQKPDLLFKHEYNYFNRTFRETRGWDFFLPLHQDDEHFLTGLRLLPKDNQAEFDSQLIALTKVLVDSLNEKEIAKGLTTLKKDDKGITKLERFFQERGTTGYEPHVKFLRVLQDLRSRSAAHRKGSSYDKLIADLKMADEGHQKVFAALLMAATDLVRYLRGKLLPKPVIDRSQLHDTGLEGNQ